MFFVVCWRGGNCYECIGALLHETIANVFGDTRMVKENPPPSMERYISSFTQLVNADADAQVLEHHPLRLKAVEIRALPLNGPPRLQIWNEYHMFFCSEKQFCLGKNSAVKWNEVDGIIQILWEDGIVLDGGFSIACSFSNNDSDWNGEEASRTLFRYSHSTWFLAPGQMALCKDQLDVMKQYEHGLNEDGFVMGLVLDECPVNARHHRNRRFAPFNLTGNFAVQFGLVKLITHNLVMTDPTMYSTLVRMGYAPTSAAVALQRSNDRTSVALDLLLVRKLSSWGIEPVVFLQPHRLWR